MDLEEAGLESELEPVGDCGSNIRTGIIFHDLQRNSQYLLGLLQRQVCFRLVKESRRLQVVICMLTARSTARRQLR